MDAQLARASEQLETEERRISTSFGTEPTKTVAATLVSELGKDKKKDTAGVLGLVLESFLTQTARLETYGFARAFIRDVRVGLIQPLELALDQWFTRQRTVLDQSRTWNAIVREWDGLQVPSDLRPAATTILVEPQDSIPGSFEACLGLAFEGAPLLDALPKAVSEIVRGAWGANAEGSREQRLISFEQSFSLGVARSDAEADQQAGMDTRTLDNFVKRSMVTPAAFSVTGLESIEPVCRSWVLDRDGFTDFVHEGFRGWLDPNGIHIVTRRARFADKFELALRSAEPTVAFSQDAMLRIRGAGQVEPTEALAVSPYLPFADTDPLASEVRQLLAPLRLGLSNDNLVVNEADTSELNFVRSFTEGIHPLALSSLTDPILKSVREAEQKYWVGRRSRPLAHSLGLTPAQVTAFCRGWLVLRLLDLIDVKTGKVHHELQPIAIPRDRLTGKLTAENLALSRKVGANRDVWFRIALESLPLRLVNYPRDEKSLNFYVSVIELGGYQGTDADAQEQLARKGDVSLDDNLYIEILEAWLKDGVKPGELNEAGDFAQRYQDVKTTLTDLEHTWAVWTERLEAGEIESVRDPAPLTAPQQMSRHYLDAVRQLLDYVAAICGDASGEDEDQLSDMPDG